MTSPQPTRPPFDGRVPPPDFVNIETTKFCNLRCPMCHQFQDGTVLTGPHLGAGEFERWADELLPFATRLQPSVTGEPLMSKGFPRILEKAAEYGVKLEIVTNATLMNERLRRLMLPSLGSILISFDAATKETFEAIRTGADFDQVCRNVRALCDEARAMPDSERPQISLACVLMRSNIRELPALVDLTRELGADYLMTSHMHPPTEELKAESLVHDRELAMRCIDEALRRAEATLLPMTVHALGQLIAASSLGHGGRRDFTARDGVVVGLEERSVCLDRLRPWPRPAAADPARADIGERRARAWAGKDFERPRPDDAEPHPDLPESIWFCDFLWNKTYATLPGDVRTCCVPGTPVIGNLETQRFDAIWNDWVYRAMRVRIALQQPAPVCRGCQHIREVTDRREIARLLQGRPLPDPGDWQDLPAILDPNKVDRLSVAQQRAGDAAPTLRWETARGAKGYEVEVSLDRFATLAFSTSWHGPLLAATEYRLPDWAWSQAPRQTPVYWRAVAWIPGNKLEVGLGVLERS